MSKINPDTIRINDMLKAIADIENFAAQGLADRKTLFASAYAIAIIGEAAGRLSPELQKQYSHVPWLQITGMRNRIIHGYGQLNTQRLKEAIRRDIPVLKGELQTILATLQ